MKATLEFNLPDEDRDHHNALHGADWKGVCEDLDRQLRDWLKHGHKFKTPYEALQAVRTLLNTLADDSGLRIGE